jgi:hypothetical protein
MTERDRRSEVMIGDSFHRENVRMMGRALVATVVILTGLCALMIVLAQI